MDSSRAHSGTVGASSESSGLDLLDGEYATNVVTPISYALARRRGGGGEFDGALHITNFRLVLQRTGPGKATFGCGDELLKWISFPLSCIKTVLQADEDPLAMTLTGKDLRSCRMRFPSKTGVFVATLAQLILSMSSFAQSSPEKSFAFAHASAASRRRAAHGKSATLESKGGAESISAGTTTAETLSTQPEAGTIASNNHGQDRSPCTAPRREKHSVLDDNVDSWLPYDTEAEFVRQGMIRPKSLDSPTPAAGSQASVEAESSAEDKEPRWRLFYNRSHALVPTYPLYLVVPTALSDADIRAIAAYRSKGRLPAVTWMDPRTNAVLARSAQPLAGLGGNSCAEDERLLAYFRQQGKRQGSQSPPPPPVSAPPVRKNPAASPEICVRRVKIPPNAAAEDVVSRRKEARARHEREVTGSNRRSPSQLHVADVTAAMLDSGAVVQKGANRSEWTMNRKFSAESSRNGLDSKGSEGKIQRGAVAVKIERTRGESQLRAEERKVVKTPPALARGVVKEGHSRGDVGGKTDEVGDKDEAITSFLDMVKMSQWSPPWSLTSVNVQSQEQQRPMFRNAGKRSSPTKQEQHASADSTVDLERKIAGDGLLFHKDRAKTNPAKPKNESPILSKEKTAWAMGGTRQGRTPDEGGEEAGADGDGQPRLCVLDARTAVAAIGNKLIGKGVETGLGCGGSTQLVFSGIGNIHAVKDAFEELRNALDPLRTRLTENWKDDSPSAAMVEIMSRGLGLAKSLDLTQALGEELEEGGVYTLWPRMIRKIMGASVLAARLLRLTGCSVLVHCSDGWDRTPQICATTQLLLDPFFRTLEGFCVLIEKEWLSFGHKFWARCMGGTHENTQDSRTKADESPGAAPLSTGGGKHPNGSVKQYEELSPVFVQFLDVVHNIVAQFPKAFEYTEELLGFVAEHTFSGLYGTFLCDTDRRRKLLKLREKTISIWTVVLSNRKHFTNPDYGHTEEPLWPSLAPCKIRLWERQHCRLPALRAHHAFAGQVWEERISTTVRLSK